MRRAGPGPRGVARALLSAALPPDQRRVVLGDLDEEFSRHIVPSRSRARATLWYWRQVALSIGPALSMRRRRRVVRGASRERRLVMRRLVAHAWQDAGFALRFFTERPGFTAAAVATCALGIGANTALFSLVYGVVLRPLPYHDPDRLVRIWSANPRGIARNSVSPPDFFDLRDQAQASGAFSAFAGYIPPEVSTLERHEPVRAIVSTVTPNLFDTLGVRPAQGRPFGAHDAASGDQAFTVMISDRARLRWFGSGESVVGRTVSLDGRPHAIAGVMPPGFAFPAADIDFWIPLQDSARRRQRSARYMDVVARLGPGVTVRAGEDVLRTIARRLEAEHPQTNAGWSATVVPLHDSIVGDARRPLLVLLGAVACVLLISCANLTSLLLARGISRTREFAVRAALGASRGRVLRQQFVESGLLAIAGGAAGLVLAAWSIDVLKSAGGYQLPRLDEIGIDARLLAIALALSAVTAMLAGLLPAWRASRADAGDALKSARAAGVSVSGRRTRSVLVIAEIALTLALLTGAGLLVRSFARLAGVDAGFRADHVLLAEVALPFPAYPREQWAAYFAAALDQIRALPGVESAGAGAPLPLAGTEGLMRFGLLIDGRTAGVENRSDRVYLRRATPDYFRAMGIPLVRGRAFSDSDRADAPPVAVIDETFADRHFPGEDPIGRRVRPSNDRTWREIVGVVGPVRQTSLERAAEPHLYVTPAQSPWPAMTFVVRASSSPASITAALRERIRRIDPALPSPEVTTLDEVVAGAAAGRRFNALVLSVFALLAVTLTVVGIYGVVAYWINDSTREIGVRIALGAARADIMGSLLGRSLRLTAVGCAIGVPLALAGGQMLEGLLYGIPAADPATLAAAILAVLAASTLASYLPARRALRIDPAQSLRSE
jgi:predicted permease